MTGGALSIVRGVFPKCRVFIAHCDCDYCLRKCDLQPYRWPVSGVSTTTKSLFSVAEASAITNQVKPGPTFAATRPSNRNCTIDLSLSLSAQNVKQWR